MAAKQTQQQVNFLEIISKVSHIVEEHKSVGETLNQIAEALQVFEELPNPTFFRLIYDGEEYATKNFVKTAHCSERSFKTFKGKIGHIHLCSKRKYTTGRGQVKTEKFYFLNTMVSILLRFLNTNNQVDGNTEVEVTKPEKGIYESISSEFLQKFLNKHTFSRDVFHDLMTYKVKEILLISSLYDAYAIERDGRFSEHMLGQYGQLNLTSLPRITGVTSLTQALDILNQKHFDLIIYMVGVDKHMPITVSEKIKEKFPFVPIFLLLNNNSDAGYFVELQGQLPYIDQIFAWNGDPNIFFTMIKYLEDQVNVSNDTKIGDVRVILIVEDSPVYYSRYLSFLYRVVLDQTKRIIEDVAADELYKVLRLRARPKILLASTFDEAVSIIQRYKKYMLCLITDVKFFREGKMDENAGIELLEYVSKDLSNLPTILQSSDDYYAEVAEKYNSLFIHKHSKTLYQDFKGFIKNYLGFGDFVFKDKYGNQIAMATNMKSFENNLRDIPEDSLVYHGSKDHFSMWLMARGEIRAASIINPKKVDDFKDTGDLRRALLELIKEHRNEQETGNIIPYNYQQEINERNIYTLAEGSLGGKGRGLSFINALIDNYDFKRILPDINIRTPITFIIGTQEFESFIQRNGFEHLIYEEADYEIIKRAFLKGLLSPELRSKLSHILKNIKKPLAIRSSGMFEDSLTQPFAGIFDTYLMPNNHPDHNERLKQVGDAIKLVFASAYSSTAKGYVRAINYKIEDEKMAVVLQEVVGKKFNNLFYPHISGVAQSYNFYPFSHMKPEEGFGIAGIGLGKYVVEGNRAFRFSPKYPSLEINSPKDQFKNSQLKFYAVNLDKKAPDLLQGEAAGLVFEDISVAEKQKTLTHSVSTFDPQNYTIHPGMSRKGPRIVNFANILRYNYIPLAQTLDLVLELGRDAMGTEVEIEYAVNLTKDKTGLASFYILQIKPLISSPIECEVDKETIPLDKTLLYSEQGMGNGCIENIQDVIYVDAERFDKSKTELIAEEIEKFNEKMIRQGKQYVLIGPGRWGTRDRWIGIPVKWHQISNAKVIIETSLDNFPLDASSGSHFFHNVTTMNVGYFTVQPEMSNSFIKYDFLSNEKLVEQGTFLNHVKFKRKLIIKMDGKNRIYCIHT